MVRSWSFDNESCVWWEDLHWKGVDKAYPCGVAGTLEATESFSLIYQISVFGMLCIFG